MSTWYGDGPPLDMPAPGIAGWLRVLRRGGPIALVVFGGLAVLLLLRLIEGPLAGDRRPVTPHITRVVCRITVWLIGLTLTVRGRPMTGTGAQVANHASWLDIFALNACQTVYFVSKAEVAGWPGIGWLARATGTLFINRDRKEAQAQTTQFRKRLLSGHRLLFFPEGTSSDAKRVLTFKTTLFAAFFAEDLKPKAQVQPVTVTYTPPPDTDPRLYGWWGDMEFGSHFIHVLAQPAQGQVEIDFAEPLRVSEVADRKALAKLCEEEIRATHQALRSKSAITSSTE